MGESTATSLDSLPNELKGENKVAMNITEKNEKINNPNQQPTELSKDSINQIVQGLQQASQSNLTGLPSRDIPMNNSEITHDNTLQPNYIPEPQKNNYIEEGETIEDLIKHSKNNKVEQDRLDMLYDELQTPLLSMILYFFFQLPYFKKILVKNVPSLFLKDGNPSLYGYIFNTFIFGISFYTITKFSKYMSEF